MIETSLEKIKKVVERRGFTNFWEAFRYMSDAGYSELESLKIGLEIFNGCVWDKVIHTAYKQPNENKVYFSSGSTATYTSGMRYFAGVDVADIEPDDLMAVIYIMTKEANPIYLPIYKSYIETRKYAEISELESHIISI